jgi:hypothetical protein
VHLADGVSVGVARGRSRARHRRCLLDEESLRLAKRVDRHRSWPEAARGVVERVHREAGQAVAKAGRRGRGLFDTEPAQRRRGDTFDRLHFQPADERASVEGRRPHLNPPSYGPPAIRSCVRVSLARPSDVLAYQLRRLCDAPGPRPSPERLLSGPAPPRSRRVLDLVGLCASSTTGGSRVAIVLEPASDLVSLFRPLSTSVDPLDSGWRARASSAALGRAAGGPSAMVDRPAAHRCVVVRLARHALSRNRGLIINQLH